MRARDLASSGGTSGLCLVGVLLAAIMAAAGSASAAEPDGNPARNQLVAKGEELFRREWLPGTPSAHGGDGVGPVYNDTSCVACHNLGGVGGAGGADKNVDFLTAVVTPVEGEARSDRFRFSRGFRDEGLNSIFTRKTGIALPKPRAKGSEPDRESLISLHSGFRNASSVVHHRYGTDPNYEVLRLLLLDPMMATLHMDRPIRLFSNQSRDFAQGDMRESHFSTPAELGHFTLVRTQLNPPALFGAGLIDSIPDQALEEAAKRRYAIVRVHGRVNRLSDGRIGRFGWKAQAASLDDFVLTACALELGLEVPGREQAADPARGKYRSPGLDLNRAECNALTAYVASLPAPLARKSPDERIVKAIEAGRSKFNRIGCAACHHERLGDVEGIYSDLLLHDMGDELADRSSYGPSIPDTSDEVLPGSFALDELFPSGSDAFEGAAAFRGPARREWRTPPLWGLRDTGPYLHDCRAATLDQAIALHNGEASSTAIMYFKLPRADREEVLAFLKSLGAPRHASRARLSDQEPLLSRAVFNGSGARARD